MNSEIAWMGPKRLASINLLLWDKIFMLAKCRENEAYEAQSIVTMYFFFFKFQPFQPSSSTPNK